MLEAYRKHVAERVELGVVPQPLNAQQTAELVELLKNPPADEAQTLLELFEQRVPAGVDDAAYVKAGFLAALAKGEATSPLIDAKHAVKLLGTMLGGYNIAPMIEALDNPEVADVAADGLSHTLLMFDAFHDVKEKAEKGNAAAKRVMQSWADAEWFTSKPEVAEKITMTVFKVPGETNTDDLSPAVDAWSRPDIPLHATAMLKFPRDNFVDNPLEVLEQLKQKGHPVAYVGDVVGTGSSRKSATNSVLWHTGDDIPYIPNKREGGFCLGSKIAPIFFNTMEDAGALPIEVPVDEMNMGDVIDVYPYAGKVCKAGTDDVIAEFELKTQVLLDEVRAGGRIPLIIGRGLTERAREALGLEPTDVFRRPEPVADSGKGFSQAQKMVGRACGVEGVRPGQYCEPKMTTVGSQDTTGPMTRDELKDLACLGFSADLVMQSFCHTAAYPKPIDVNTHHTLPDFMMNRGGVSLRPGDGVIHSWLNRMLLPDTVGTGGDSHTRFPMGISFPAGSGLVAFAAATGVMPLDMPESVLVRFKGTMQPGVTLRDLVNAIPLAAIKRGLLTVEKKGKKNIFSGRIVEIEGLDDLKVEQAFELADATAERSAAGCSIALGVDPLKEYMTSNVTLLRWMIEQGYGDARTLERRARKMEEWLANPELIKADDNADYCEIIEIDLNEIKEPILACPNDPDDVKVLSEVAGAEIDEVFIGSCMTNIG
ncbi:MAG: bifunctional aconitate hydratase 2/2-methylisocitrate dehydratase, partial [Gammaproteobacteria bacterium]|nr:bifunctional aconitate hydratase 2/2-methylisocitrate dehydratase [Gammaproteobacteria bacterium]